jgi:RND family efflux transporter MFP subunit
VLASIDRSVQVQTIASLAAQVKVAQADAGIAQSELDRAGQLVDRGFISKADLDRKTATRDSALARVRVAQAQLAETQARTGRLDIRAPAAGLVLTRNIEPGQVVGAGSGILFRIAKDGELELRATLSESDLAAIPVGASAQVTPVGTDRHFAGKVWQVSPVIDPQSRQGIVRISLGYDPNLRPGGFASGDITSGSSQVPQLPQSAVQSDEKGNFVYVLDAKNIVTRRSIKIGQVSDSGVSIAQGLQGNERVVVSAGAFLNPGQKVIPLLQQKQG